MLCFSGCAGRNGEEDPGESLTRKVTATPRPTATITPKPTLTDLEELELYKKEREEERLALTVSPTPGPEPYALLEEKREVKVGDIVTIGKFCHVQTPEYTEPFPVKWQVLDIVDGKALMITVYGLTAIPFMEDEWYYDYCRDGVLTSWSLSYIRKWFQNYFKYIFDETEASCILTTKIHTPDNRTYQSCGGDDTLDRLFLLSYRRSGILLCNG